MKKIIKKYTCDRCGKEIKINEGSIESRKILNPKNLYLVQSGLLREKKIISHEEALDLCQDCFQSLHNWFSSDEYKRVESIWNIETDIVQMNKAIVLMAQRIVTYRKALNDTESEDLGGFIIKTVSETVTEFLDQVEEK